MCLCVLVCVCVGGVHMCVYMAACCALRLVLMLSDRNLGAPSCTARCRHLTPSPSHTLAQNMGSVKRTIVHMLSGRNLGGGIAYLSALCNPTYGFGLSGQLGCTFTW